jgi:hypothetical protein
MRDWSNIEQRRDAVMRFRDFMEDHDDILQTCIDSPVTAKQQFAEKGDIQIPTDVEFRVYRATDAARHKLAVLILPSSKGGRTDEPANILIAAWPAWGTTKQQIAELENQLVFLRQELAAEEQSGAGPH